MPFKDEKYSHIEEAEIKKVKDKVDDRFNWFNQKLNENAKTPPTVNPAVYPSQIETERKVGFFERYLSLESLILNFGNLILGDFINVYS